MSEKILELAERIVDMLRRRAAGYEQYATSIYNGRIIADELKENARKIEMMIEAALASSPAQETKIWDNRPACSFPDMAPTQEPVTTKPVALDHTAAAKAAEAIFDYTDNNLTMFDATDCPSEKAQQLYETAKILRDMFRGDWAAIPAPPQPKRDDIIEECAQAALKAAEDFDETSVQQAAIDLAIIYIRALSSQKD